MVTSLVTSTQNVFQKGPILVFRQLMLLKSYLNSQNRLKLCNNKFISPCMFWCTQDLYQIYIYIFFSVLIDGCVFVKEHEVECRRLVQKYPDMSAPIRSKLTELQEKWRGLQALGKHRRDALTTAFTTHKFLSDLRELHLWVNDTIEKMNSSELPTNIAEAEALLELHNERKVPIIFKLVSNKSVFWSMSSLNN